MNQAVTYNDIAAMTERAQELKSVDMGSGGAAAAAFRTAISEGVHARVMFTAACPPDLARARDEAVGYMQTNVAMMLHDGGHETAATDQWNQAFVAAGRAKNWSLIARVMGQMARQKIALGQAQEAVGLVDAALEGAQPDELLSVERAMLYALKARALGTLGDATGTTVAVAQSQGYWGEILPRDADPARPWIGHYDAAHQWGDIGAAWRELAATGSRSVQMAIGSYEQASLAHGDRPRSMRSAALVHCSRAFLEASYGDLDAAVEQGHHGLNLGETVRSGRLTSHYTELHTALGPYKKKPQVAELLERIRSNLVS